MVPPPYFKTITNKSTFESRFKAEKRTAFSQLDYSAASTWDREHLFACRVLRRNKKKNHYILPILSKYKQSSDLHVSSEIKKFLKGPSVPQLSQSEHDLVRNRECGVSLGQIWASMAKLIEKNRRNGDAPDSNVHHETNAGYEMGTGEEPNAEDETDADEEADAEDDVDLGRVPDTEDETDAKDDMDTGAEHDNELWTRIKRPRPGTVHQSYVESNAHALKTRSNSARSDAGDEMIAEAETRTKRRRLSTSHKGYADSGTIEAGSNSEQSEPSQESTSFGDYIDSDSHKSMMPSEDETIRFVSCVIRHILYFAPPQDNPILPSVVDFRDAKTRRTATTWTGGQKIAAIDDGGLYLRRKLNGILDIQKGDVAIVEGKKEFQHLENGRPIISDKCFAQMTCEALAVRLAPTRGQSDDSVIMINATQHYLCFLQFDITEQYLNDFESDEPKSFLIVNSTVGSISSLNQGESTWF